MARVLTRKHYNDDMGAIRILGRLGIMLFVLTIVGQIPVKGKSLEQRYHQSVNSSVFQKTFWTVFRPVTWTGEKVQDLYIEYGPELLKRNAKKAQEKAEELEDDLNPMDETEAR